MGAITVVPAPFNEPVHDYAQGSPERARLRARLDELGGRVTDITQVIGGDHRPASGAGYEVVQPHRPQSMLSQLTASQHPRP